jgi:hypothetical protein
MCAEKSDCEMRNRRANGTWGAAKAKKQHPGEETGTERAMNVIKPKMGRGNVI